jgi:hypothetical protein
MAYKTLLPCGDRIQTKYTDRHWQREPCHKSQKRTNQDPLAVQAWMTQPKAVAVRHCGNPQFRTRVSLGVLPDSGAAARR